MRDDSFLGNSFLVLSATLAMALGGCSSTISGRGQGTQPATTDGGTSSNNGAPNSTSCTLFGDECSCSFAGAGKGNATACSEQSIPTSICCGDIGWPDKNLTCSCKAYTCK